MTVRVCPRCKSLRLSHNGAYWVCAQCELAISGQALAVENRLTACTGGQTQRKSPFKMALAECASHSGTALPREDSLSPGQVLLHEQKGKG